MTEQEAKALVEWFKARKGKTLKLNDNGIDCVVEALEKQIAKKVIKPKDGLESYYHEESCPNCKEEFYVKVVGYRFTSAIGEVNYCPHCGQKLDWGNEDD